MNDFINGILPNAEWDLVKYLFKVLFSGKKQESQDTEFVLKQELVLQVANSAPRGDFRVFSERLRVFLKLVNASIIVQFSESKLAKAIGESSPEMTIRYFDGQSIPNFEYVTRLYDKFGFNEDFFHGTSLSVFSARCEMKFDPKDYFSVIESIGSEHLYFLMDGKGNVSIVARMSETNYRFVARDLRISADLGHTGFYNMNAIRELIHKIKQSKRILDSIILSDDDYSMVCQGLVYLGILDHPKVIKTQWADDFVDSEYFKSSPEVYLNKYGKDFVDVMELLD